MRGRARTWNSESKLKNRRALGGSRRREERKEAKELSPGVGGEARRAVRMVERKRSEGERTKPRGSLVRLCEIKTRFTGSFYCGLDVFFVSLSLHATVPFNRFNEYIVYQWSLREYRVSLFPNNFYLLLSASLPSCFLFATPLLIPVVAFFLFFLLALSPSALLLFSSRRNDGS